MQASSPYDITATVKIAPPKNLEPRRPVKTQQGVFLRQLQFFSRLFFLVSFPHSSLLNFRNIQIKMAAESEKQNFFEPIGNQAQGLATGTDGAAAEEDDIKPVDEIESLCMNCHENVSRHILQTLLNAVIID